MNGVALLVVIAGAGAAIFAAFADAALLGIDPDDIAADPRLGPLADRRERAHRSLSFLRFLAYVAAGAGTAALLDLPPRDLDTTLLFALLGAGLLAAAAEGAARATGDAFGAPVAITLAPAMALAETLATPIVHLGEWVDRRLLSIIPRPSPNEESREASEEQFLEVVTSEAEVTHDQQALLHRVFSLGETEVREIMVPRIDIVGVEHDDPWSEVIDRVRSSEHARLPVYRETVDEVVGMLYAKDLLPAVVAGEPPAQGWQALMRSTLFIPPTKQVDDQLREFRATGTHIAIVVDEYGGTAGLVTIEDVLEELVGEIRDEYDVEAPDVEEEDGMRWWVSARITLDELSDLIRYDFRREGITTVGGLVYDLLGRVPRAGEELSIGNFRVIVERVVKRRVQRVYFERLEAPDDDGNADQEWNRA